MISSADFMLSLLGAMGAWSTAIAPEEGPRTAQAGRETMSCRADPMTASGQLSRPPAGTFVTAYGQSLVSVVIHPDP